MTKSTSVQSNALFQQAISAHQQSQWQSAESLYRQTIELNPDFIPAYINLGSVYRQTGKLEKANQCYKRALSYKEDSLEAWFNLGNLNLSEKNLNDAKTAFKQVLKLKSDHTGALAKLASIARQENNWPHVIQHLEQWLKLENNASDAHLELGNAYRHVGRNEDALRHYKLSLHYAPESWKAHYSLARLSDQLGDDDTFNHHYHQALIHSTEPHTIHSALAQTRFDNGHISGAIEQYNKALEVKADLFEAQLGLAAALMANGQVEQSKQIFQKLSHLDDVHALSLLAKEIWNHKFFAEAIAVLEKMVQLRDDLFDTHLNLAKAYSQTWQFSKAIPSITHTLERKPDCEEAKDLLADIYLRQGRCDESIIIYQQKLARGNFHPSDAASLLFTMLYSHELDASAKARHHQQLMDKIYPQPRLRQFKQKKEARSQLKIGYISADFRDQHPVGLFTTPVLQFHNKQQFSIYAYYNNRTYDESTQRIRENTAQWLEVSSWTDQRLQQQIIADEIDILIDLSGQTAKNRLGVFALGAAPIQVSWLGYPHSSGLKAIDYLIADPYCCPESNDHLCAETVIRLKDFCVFCYPQQHQYPAYKASQATSEQLVFGSFNNLTKVNSHTLNLWVRLLKKIPHAHLHLKTPSFTDPECIKQFYKDFESQGIPKQRLTLTGPCGLEEMMHAYLNIDICLDPTPYNGGTTTLQALWMGVPVITLKGDNFCGLMGCSILTHGNMTDWIADDEDAYIALAQEKAADLKKLRSFKEQLRNQLSKTALFDNQGFTRALESTYFQLWEHYRQNG